MPITFIRTSSPFHPCWRLFAAQFANRHAAEVAKPAVLRKRVERQRNTRSVGQAGKQNRPFGALTVATHPKRGSTGSCGAPRGLRNHVLPWSTRRGVVCYNECENSRPCRCA